MKQKIQELIDFHKSAKQEVFEMLNELNSVSEDKISSKEIESLRNSILKLECELAWRSTFVSQLEDII